MKKIYHYILILAFLLPLIAIGQKAKEPVSYNQNVLEAFEMHKDKNYEGAIKKTLQLLSSNDSISKKDTIHVFNILAENLYRIGDFKLALHYAKASARVNHEKIKPVNYQWLMRYLNAAEEYDTSIYNMKRAMDYLVNESEEQNTHALARTYNDIGFTYYLNNQKDSAELYYLKVISLDGIKETYSSMYGLSTGNLGNLYYENGEYEKALEHFSIDAELTKGKIWKSFNNAIVGKAECYVQLKDYRTAEKELLLVFDQKHHTNKNLMKAYKLMSNVCEHLNKSSASAYWLKKYVLLNDSLIEIERPKEELVNQLSQSRINLIQKDLKIAEHSVLLKEKELTISKNKEKTQQLKTRIYIALSITFFLIGVMAFFFYNGRLRRKNAIIKLENDLLEAELKNKKNDLTNFSTNLSYKRKFIEDFEMRLKDVQSDTPEKTSSNLTMLIREFKNYRVTNDSIDLKQSDIDKVNASFYDKLNKEFPLLTQNEKELCGLFLLNLSSKDIAVIRNVSPNAIKKARQRIRKKLPIHTQEDLGLFLEGLRIL